VFRLPPLTPVVRALLIALLGLFVLFAILENFMQLPVLQLFVLEPRQLSPFTPLQLFAHVFILPPTPDAVFWLAVSGYFLWLIVAPFEERYGARRVLELVVVAALSAGIAALLAGQLAPAFAGPIAGPQTITLCALSAYAMLLPPYSEVSFFGIMLRPKHLLGVLLAFSAVGFLTSRNAASFAADLGAMGGGIAFVRYWMQRPPPRKSKRKPPAKFRVVGRDSARERDSDEPPKRWLN
jgi:membrane associated rhomboid family serine protease